jgi:hypothetical protein
MQAHLVPVFIAIVGTKTCETARRGQDHFRERTLRRVKYSKIRLFNRRVAGFPSGPSRNSTAKRRRGHRGPTFGSFVDSRGSPVLALRALGSGLPTRIPVLLAARRAEAPRDWRHLVAHGGGRRKLASLAPP